jgi:UDP-glucose-4-epimerase GalE
VNVLVTGGAGYIGSLTCKELHKRGYNVFVFDNLSNSQASFVKWGQLIEGDINDKELLFSTLKKNKIEAVFHFAGVIEVGESMRDPMKYMLNNVVGTYNLLEGIAENGVKHVIFSSSCATYGNTEKIPISEDNIQQPVSVYGETKLFGERMIHDLSVASQLCSVVLRYFNAAGADPDGETGENHDPETHLVPLVIKSVFDDNYTLQVFGDDYPTSDGTCVRDYAHVTDLAIAHVKALEWSMKSKASFEAFNLGSGRGSTVMEVIQAVEKYTQGKVKHRIQPRRPGDSSILVADISKAQSMLGWNPELSNLETVVRTACNWHGKFLKK